MERLIGKKVTHNDFGEGVIIGVEEKDKAILSSIRFPIGGTRKYSLQIALGKTLSTNDNEIRTILDDIAKSKEEAVRKAEQGNIDKEQLKNIEKSKEAAENGDRTIAIIDRTVVFRNKTTRIFKVHQGQTFDEERRGSYIWAPASGIHHHERMTEIRPGDIIFHYSDGGLVAVSEALSDCFPYPRPMELDDHGWGYVGYRVELRYEVLDDRFSLNPYRNDIITHRAHRFSSFTRNGDACQGYLYDLEDELAKLFASELLNDNQTSGVVRVLNRIG